MAWNTPATWAAGSILTAAQLNAQVRDNLTELGGAWSAYTPAVSGLTLGNGTVVGRRSLAGKLVHFSLVLTWGSTTSVSANIGLGLPTASASTVLPRFVFGNATLTDSSATAYRNYLAVSVGSGSVTGFQLYAADGVTVANATVPWSWATGDTIQVNGVYEAA